MHTELIPAGSSGWLIAAIQLVIAIYYQIVAYQIWLQSLPAWLATTVGVVLGLLVGSFLNVVIYRLPRMLERQWAADARQIVAATAQTDAGPDSPTAPADAAAPDEPFNLAVPRSRCPVCGHEITWVENIPVLSYLALRGHCSACRAPISARYPLVELLTGVLFAACAWRWGLSATALAGCVFAAMLVALAGIDWDTALLPDDLTVPLLWAGLIASVLGLTEASPIDAICGAAIGYLALWVLYKVHKRLTGKDGMGYGDFKLLAALGAWVGWKGLLPAAFLAAVTGIIAWLFLVVFDRLHEGKYVKFGPFLALGGLVTLLIGTHTLLGYVGLDG